MRVAHLLPTLEIGGKERSVVDLCAEGPALGIEPLIVTYDPDPVDRALLDSDATRVRLDRRDRNFAASLRALVRDRRIDLVHAHGHVAAIYAAPAPCATVCTAHVALGSGWRWLPQIVPALRRMGRLTAVSEDLARATRRVSGRAVEVVPTGVDTSKFLPCKGRGTPRSAVKGYRANERGIPLNHAAHDPPPPTGEEFRVGIAARLHPVKRHRDAFAAMELLARRGIRARLLVAGDGPLDAELRATAPANVEMLGALADMPAFYAGLDALLLCSDHEGLPLALLEGMASGLPCIATRAGGMVELIGDGGNGVIGVPRRDQAALAEAIASLARQPEVRAALGSQARAASLGRSLAAQAARYADLYRALGRRAA